MLPPQASAWSRFRPYTSSGCEPTRQWPHARAGARRPLQHDPVAGGQRQRAAPRHSLAGSVRGHWQRRLGGGVSRVGAGGGRGRAAGEVRGHGTLPCTTASCVWRLLVCVCAHVRMHGSVLVARDQLLWLLARILWRGAKSFVPRVPISRRLCCRSRRAGNATLDGHLTPS